MSSDGYNTWRRELKTPITPGERGDSADIDYFGFWRLVGARIKADWPVAIWPSHEGHSIVRIGNREFELDSDDGADFIASSWPWCVAIERKDYEAARASGRWGDGKPARTMDEAEKLGIDTKAGGNNPPLDELLADQIKSLADVLDKTPEPADQDAANKLSGNLEKMRGLLKLAEAERVKLKEPYLAAGREVDAAWAGIKAPGEQAGINAEARRKAFLKKLQAKLDAEAVAERKRLQDIADAENERIRAENQKRIDEAQDHGGFDPSDPTDTQPELIPEVVAPVVETPRAVAGAAYGRASGLKKTMVAYVENPEALAMHFIKSNDPDFSDYLLGRAKSALRGKVVLPGCGAREELK